MRLINTRNTEHLKLDKYFKTEFLLRRLIVSLWSLDANFF